MLIKTNKDIRVIVPCHNSDLTIEKCISSIIASCDIDFELIAVDDGCNSRLEHLAKLYSFRIFRTSGNEGAGKARNLGTNGFNGKIVVFIDSDVQIFPDTLKLLIVPILDQSASATVGSYAKSHLNNFFECYKHNYLAYKYSDKKYLVNTFWSAVCAVDLDAFRTLSGFNGYSGAGPEDIDLGIALTESGHKIISVPEAAGIHLATYNLLKLIKNDLRKGSEDIYIHWKRNVPLYNNRHISRNDLISVFLACSMPVLLLFHEHPGTYVLFGSILFYAALRIRFIMKAFDREGFIFKLRSFLMTFVLDITRGLSVVTGTLLYLAETISSGRYKPFFRIITN